VAFEGEIVGERVWDGIRTPVIRFEFVTPLNGDGELAAEAERLVK
jgi:hypothetical protein